MRPALLSQYVEAQRKVYQHNPYIPLNLEDRFAEREIILALQHIPTRKYAFVISRVWVGWVKSKGLKYLPPLTFLGTVSLQRYQQVLSKPSINLYYPSDVEDMCKAKVFEQRFALSYVTYRTQGGQLSEQDYLNQYLNTYTVDTEVDAWFDYCEYKGRDPVRAEVLEQLIFTNIAPRRRRPCLTYDEFVELCNAS